MELQLTDREYEYLAALLRNEEAKLIHELHRTDSRDFKKLLKEQMQINEALQGKVGSTTTA